MKNLIGLLFVVCLVAYASPSYASTVGRVVVVSSHFSHHYRVHHHHHHHKHAVVGQMLIKH